MRFHNYFYLWLIVSAVRLIPSSGLLVRHRHTVTGLRSNAASDNRLQQKQHPLFAPPPKTETKQAVDNIAQLANKPSTMGETIRSAAGSIPAFPRETMAFTKKITSILHWKGFSFFLLMGWFLVPVLEKLYNLGNGAEEQANSSSDTNSPYRRSLFHLVVDHVSQASKIAFSVYVVDALRIGLQALGFHNIPHLAKIPHAYMRLAYTFWIADRVAALKRYFVAYKTNSLPENLPSKIKLVNRLSDVFIYSAGFIAAVAAVRVDLGSAAKGFVALGSFSTLLVSLATQNVASQLASGVFLDLSGKIEAGDSVRFGDKGEGAKVERLGWLSTVMRGSDDVKAVVPNKALVDKEMSNLSRVKTSQVKQTLKFKYQYISKVPQLMESIKDEIRESCPDLVTDGSRPFRAHWTDMGSNLEVVVDCHFNIPPVGDKYWDNRQQVLMAIARAVQRENVEFA